ncbi:hypothetical protein P389DRAFT_172521 [Cystobasidium minutum MCA 4210]|uniref:uncharacterized protein n=1 Tax=Cystobasidium minutum MCA 4210 TaxID=1397322 RepID=UPI0034CDCDC2|eukprot:jgi/Rhomi1/172521/fgenesh1_kg.5_\
MLARRATQVARMAAASSSKRSFTSSVIVKRDFVQDLYLRELKQYKPKEMSANAHVGNVKEFHTPAAPKAPVVPTGAELAKEIEAYEREEVEASSDAGVASEDAESAAVSQTQTADEYISFVEQEARRQPSPDAHH